MHHRCKTSNSQMSEFVGKLGLNLYLTDDCVCMIDDEEELKVAVFSCFYFDISFLFLISLTLVDLYYVKIDAVTCQQPHLTVFNPRIPLC